MIYNSEKTEELMRGVLGLCGLRTKKFNVLEKVSEAECGIIYKSWFGC